MGKFVEYMKQHIWVPILIAIGIAFFLLIILWLICRHRRKNRFDYFALGEDRSLMQKWDEERKIQKMAERDTVLLNCYYYLKDSKTYSFINHLPDIGSRINKQWFLVHESQQKIDVVLTMVPWSTQCVIPFTRGTKKMLKELFSLLQHPYIFPVMDIDFVFEHNLVMFIHPFQSGGSLKDVIYGSHPQTSWEGKYQVKGKALSLTQIRNYGRQVLEALLYLRDKGLPSCGHVHSGNVFIVNGTSKLSGFENCLFGWKSRLNPTIKKLFREKKGDVDVIQFGKRIYTYPQKHTTYMLLVRINELKLPTSNNTLRINHFILHITVLIVRYISGHLMYEMLAGYELTTAEPKKEHLVNFRNAPVVEVINFIFVSESGMYPTLDELVSHSFFKGGDVSGLEKFNPGPVRLSSNVKQLLKLCRKESEEIQRKRRPSTKKAKSEDREAVQKDRKLSKSKSKRPPVDKPAAVPIVQFHPEASSPPNIQLPPPKEAPPPPRSKRQSSYDRAPPKLPSTTGRGALLSQIQEGAKLKKAVTNDRSAPRV